MLFTFRLHWWIQTRLIPVAPLWCSIKPAVTAFLYPETRSERYFSIKRIHWANVRGPSRFGWNSFNNHIACQRQRTTVTSNKNTIINAFGSIIWYLIWSLCIVCFTTMDTKIFFEMIFIIFALDCWWISQWWNAMYHRDFFFYNPP